ncbi:phosphotransferase [uncultured Amphritea sp.]|uniref:phosphotransferase enzyme family protein n=1 Tax=uncultured Amphritea sp. TaxID=981605 RepID=UPI0026296946|nr:phosphotransferase [uncultured Amphritea sp.]
MNSFYEIGPAQQCERLQQLAQKALRHWQLDACSIELIKYRENAVFAVVTTTGVRYALRIHRPEYHSDAALRSELQWMEALNKVGVLVPEVIPTAAGELLITEQLEGIPEPRQLDLFAWIDGEQLGSVEHGLGDNAAQISALYFAIGETAGRLHNQSSHWPLPEGFQRHAWDCDGLVGEQPFWGRFWELELLTSEQKALITEAREKVRLRLQQLPRAPQNYSLIHADFVPENLMADGAGVRLLDFDDAGFGWHMFELATALYFIIEENVYDVAKEALFDGYRQHRHLSEGDLGLLELFLTARGFTYLGWIRSRQETQTAQELAPELIRMACQQAKRFLSQS